MRRIEPRVARFTLTEAPELVTSVLLNEGWDFPKFSLDACKGSSLFCVRCHLLTQLDLVRSPERPLPRHMLLAVIVADLLTLGCPCGFYSGLGTSVLGCATRTAIRHKYRLEGTGFGDLMLTMCCAHCAAAQQRKQLEKEGVTYQRSMC